MLVIYLLLGYVNKVSAEEIRINIRLDKKALLVGALAVAIIGLAAGLFIFKLHGTGQQANAGISSPGKLVSIPAYYPRNLPAGFTYNNDAKALKPDVLYFSVTGPSKQKFYVTQQSIPANFDFTAFDKKFLNPDSFNADAGTATAGPAGAALIGSIRTNQNTWIIINSTSTGALPQLETIIRALKLAQ